MTEDWQKNYKEMTTDQLSAEYQRLLRVKKEANFGDKLKFLKDRFRILNYGLKIENISGN